MLSQAGESFNKALPSLIKPKSAAKTAAPRPRLRTTARWEQEGGSPAAIGVEDPNVHEHVSASVKDSLKHGSVVIAAITSCTNTSNPSVLIGAGLLAKKAVEKGLTVPPWVKTSLAPGSKTVTDYLAKAGLTPYLEKLKFHLVGYGCTTCIGNSGPLPDEVSKAIDEKELVVASVLSGNRNFEGRINSEVRANYLMSPPLVVAFALAGRIDIDLRKDPIGNGRDGQPVYMADIWPSQREIEETMEQSITSEMFSKSYADVFQGDERWRGLAVPKGETYAWEKDSTYIRQAPYFDDMSVKPAPVQDIKKARVLAVLGDSVTTDHISPAGSIKKDSPAGKYLQEHGVKPADFNSYGSRRGNHEVMVRGTFANVRLRNKLVATEGGFTRHLPDATPKCRSSTRQRKISRRRHSAGGSRRKRIRLRLVPRLGRQRPRPAGRPRRDRRKLRTHPPLEPGRHGRPAAAVPRRRNRRIAQADRRRSVRNHRHPRPGRPLRRRKRSKSPRQRRRQDDRSSTRWSASTRRRKRCTTPTAGSCSMC